MPTRSDNYNASAGALVTPSDAGSNWALYGDSWVTNGAAPGGGLTANCARCSSIAGAYAIATLDCGVGATDVTIDLVIAKLGGSWHGIVLRVIDINNFITCIGNNGAGEYRIYRYTAGTPNLLNSASVTEADGDTMTVVVSGNNYTFKQNGVTKVTTTDSQGSSSTLHGTEVVATDTELDSILFTFAGGGGGDTLFAQACF